MTIEQAREEGKAMGQAKKADGSLTPTSDSQALAVPGYSGTSQPQSTYFDDPDKLVADGTSQRATNDAYRTVANPEHTRATFSNSEIKTTTDRATGIENDPSTYLAGEAYGGASGSCTPLPPASGAGGYYEATCNQGSKIEDQPKSCSVRMVPQITNNERWFYYGVPANKIPHGFADVAYLNGKSTESVCRPTGLSKPICDAMIDLGAGGKDPTGWLKFCRGTVSGTATEFSCGAELPQGELGQHWNFKTGTVYLKKEGEKSVSVVRTEAGCAPLDGDTMCAHRTAEDVCTEGAETRIIEGVPVYQACWAWQRDFSCKVVTAGNDCEELEANGKCTYLRDDCLDETPSGPCKVTERVFRCPTPDAPTVNAPQYICGDDVYCINGDCEPIVREASTEFKDALVALHSLDQAGKEFDENNFTVFKGARETCHKPIFGLVNCCAGKVSGMVPFAAGAAALAGGPAALAAFATPFLVLFSCSQDEMKLDVKDRMGLCHKIGTYCSSSFLGICETKRTAYCCFESKLSRILQEQGRIQLGRPWGAPKTEQCKGFTIEEFALLDLSKMDFTEVYEEFIDAAKLPDEVGTMKDIQDKINNYYDLHGGG